MHTHTHLVKVNSVSHQTWVCGHLQQFFILQIKQNGQSRNENMIDSASRHCAAQPAANLSILCAFCFFCVFRGLRKT